MLGRHVFCNNSALDATSDDEAIAPDKEALLSGHPATFAKYTSYVRGINGIMVDVAGLGGTPTAEDFDFMLGNNYHPSTWSPGPTPISIDVKACSAKQSDGEVAAVSRPLALIRMRVGFPILTFQQLGGFRVV